MTISAGCLPAPSGSERYPLASPALPGKVTVLPRSAGPADDAAGAEDGATGTEVACAAGAVDAVAPGGPPPSVDRLHAIISDSTITRTMGMRRRSRSVARTPAAVRAASLATKTTSLPVPPERRIDDWQDFGRAELA